MKLNLLFFIRILLRHIWLLILVPITLGTLVFVLTKDQPKVYDSKARIYTAFATGSTIELDNTKFDYSKTNIAYDNLMNLIRSRTTIEKVALKLFTQHMILDSADIRIISKEKYAELMEEVPQEVKNLVIKGDFEKTYENFTTHMESSHDNFINELLNLEHPDYSVNEILGKITVRRISISDFVDISYQSEDPGICQNTLIILSETFIAANAEMTANQSDQVVKYFENELKQTTKDLNLAEDELLVFNKSNKLMNYYEQTKQLASRRENFELRYQEVVQRFHGAKAVLSALEKRMSVHERKRLHSEGISNLRNQLVDLNYKLTLEELNMSLDSVYNPKRESKIVDLKQKVSETKRNLTKSMDTIYHVDYDKNGVASTDVLVNWLENLINYEAANSELKALDQIRIDFDELYTWYAPLGATMKKLERKIGIEEQEYLTLLRSLGLAKLRQQNVELQSNLKVTEPPFYPIKPNPSKRMMLVIVAAIVGYVLVAATVLVLEFLDGNLNTALRAEDKIGLKVSSIFPVISSKEKKIDFQYLKNKAVNAITRNVLLNQFKMKHGSKPMINMLFSTQEAEGKTFLCRELIAKLCELGYMTLHITYDNEDIQNNINCYQKILYEINDKLYKIGDIEDFDIYNTITDYSVFDFIILELPSIIKNPFPVKLASTMDYMFLVARANRAWSEADSNALKLFNEATSGPVPTVILNGVKVLEMETVLGEIPKKRSRFRIWVKQLIQLRFFNQKSIK